MKITAPLLVRSARWLIEQNPTYLASAVCIVIGARLLLVSPTKHAGDVGLILLTLGVLQLYESLVAGLIVLLHARSRSPEDLPSLLLVMAAFWTGPMAATIEMTTHRADLGLVIALASCLIAVIQMISISRRLHLPISLATNLSCSAFVIFLAVSPPLLKTPQSADGLNEVRMYVAWLILAALNLVRAWNPRSGTSISPATDSDAQEIVASAIDRKWIDSAFFAITLAATVAHLVGMNHAFFTHAKYFYVAPLICSFAVVAVRLIGINGMGPLRIRIAAALLPLCAIIISHSSFDPEVPIERIPSLLRNPFNTSLCLAALSWWFIAWQLRSSLLMHAANACVAVMAIRLAPNLPQEVLAASTPPTRAGQIPLSYVAITFGLAAYLAAIAIIRRHRVEGILAIAATGVATILLVTHRIQPDMLVTCWTIGWCMWLMILVGSGSSPKALLATPLVFLVGVDIWFGANPTFSLLIYIHAAVMICVLWMFGLVLKSQAIRRMAITVAILEVTGVAVRWLSTTDHAHAAIAVFAGFSLLASGGLISWRKGKWLSALDEAESESHLPLTDSSN